MTDGQTLMGFVPYRIDALHQNTGTFIKLELCLKEVLLVTSQKEFSLSTLCT